MRLLFYCLNVLIGVFSGDGPVMVMFLFSHSFETIISMLLLIALLVNLDCRLSVGG